MSHLLTDADYQRAARAIGCQVAAIKAVCDVEAPYGGFLSDGRPRILFEAHRFSEATGGRYNRTHPSISSRQWDRKLYATGKTADVRGQREHDRLGLAASLDRAAALCSASWGKFQIMGFNWQACGFKSLQAFVNAMYRSEGAQLDAFVAYVKHRRLDDELRDKRWAAFAYAYNGPRYAENHYDTRMAAAFKRHGGQ